MVAAPARDAAIFAPPFPDRGYGALEGPQGLWVCALGVTQHSLVLFWLCHLFYSDAFLKAVRVRGKERFGSRLAPRPSRSFLYWRGGGEEAGSGRFVGSSTPALLRELRLFWKLLEPGAPPWCPNAGAQGGCAAAPRFRVALADACPVVTRVAPVDHGHHLSCVRPILESRELRGHDCAFVLSASLS